jgi:hypothetical protein
MTDAVAIIAFLVTLSLVIVGLRSHVPAWLLYAFAVILTLRAVERALEEGPTAQRIGGVVFYVLLVTALLYALRRGAARKGRSPES